VSHAISVELQKEDENIYTSKNTAAASRVHKVDAAKNVKSHQLKSQCSSEHGGNVQQTEGLRVTNNVPFSEALVHQSKSLEKSSDSSKTSFRNRRFDEIYSDNDLSWLEPGKPKILAVGRKPEMTYDKRRTTFRSKQEKKEIIVTKHRKKCKNNTSMNLVAEGSCSDCEGKTMTKKGTTECDGK
jgi:hypothetical protein